MKKKIFLLFFLLSYPVTNLVFPQEPQKIIITSLRVGKTIDLLERNYFKLFGNIKNFSKAIFLRKGKGQYYCRLFYYKNNNLRDSLFRTTYSRILNVALKIYFREKILKYGRQIIKGLKSRIHLVSLNDSTLLFRMKLNDVERNYLFKEGSMLPLAPFDGDPSNFIEDEKWKFGLSGFAGILGNNFKGLQQTYNSIEKILNTPKYPVPLNKFSIKSIFIYGLSSYLLVNEKMKIGAEIFYSRNTANKLHLKFNAFSIFFDYFILKNRKVAHFVSIKLISASFKSYIDYGTIPLDNEGNYLEKIKIDGNSKGFGFGGGTILKLSEILSLKFLVDYFFLPDITKITNPNSYIPSDFKPRVNMGGFVFIFSLIFN